MNCSNCTNYLRETKILDYSSKQIQLLVESRGWKNLPETERVKAIYNFVKDEILFGYNVDDGVKASRVLKDGYGQCNTKGTLFIALLFLISLFFIIFFLLLVALFAMYRHLLVFLSALTIENLCGVEPPTAAAASRMKRSWTTPSIQ